MVLSAAVIRLYILWLPPHSEAIMEITTAVHGNAIVMLRKINNSIKRDKTVKIFVDIASIQR